MRVTRQFIVTHTDTGQQTVVAAWKYPNAGTDGAAISRKANHYAPADSTVHMLDRGQEYALPFDELPLIIRRPDVAKEQEAA